MTAYTIFGNTAPTSPDVTDADGSYGTVIDIEAGVTGMVTHARWRFPATLPSGQVTWHLYDLTNSEALAEHTFAAPVAGAWLQEPLDGAGIEGPVIITGPRRVIAWVGTPDRYVATAGLFTGNAITSGPITAPATETTPNGRFGGDPLSVPNGTFQGGAYFADMVFEVPVPNAEGAADFPLQIVLSATGETPGGQGSAAFTLDLALASTGASETPIDSGVCGWNVDSAELDVCDDWAARPYGTRAAALQLASQFLWAATGRRFGICEVTIQPRQNMLSPEIYRDYPVWPGQDPAVSGPYLFGGRWFNRGCGSCCNSGGCAIVLRGPVASVTSVVVAGETVEESAYRVDLTKGAYLLVRTDGLCWPSCGAEPDDFQVTYGVGVALPVALQVAVALLACEYAKHLDGGACALPARMTRLSRQGVEIEVDAGDGATGSTGVRQVDDVIAMLNPGRRQSPPVILSPDLPESCDRQTVWGA